MPFIKLALTVGLFVVLFEQGRLDLSALTVLYDSPGTILAVLLFSLISYSAVGVRWVILLHSQKIPLSYAWGHRVNYLGIFCNLVLPGGNMAGDAVRLAHALRAAPCHRLEAFLSLFVDRLIGLYAMLFIALLAIIVHPELAMGSAPLRIMATGVVLIVIGAPVVAVLFYHLVGRLSGQPWFGRLLQWGGVGRLLTRLIDIARLYRHALPQLMLALTISVVTQMLLLWGVVLIAMALAVGSLTPLEYAFATPWAWMANFLPLTPGGIGVGEAAFDQLCRWIESAPSGAAYGTILLVYRILTMLATLPGLVLFLFDRKGVQDAMRSAP